MKKRNYKQRKKKDHWGITVDFREKEREQREMLRSRTGRKNWGRKVRAWACRRREKMLDLNISNGPSSPLPLGRLWVSGLLLSLDFRCCRCFWNHPHPTIRCWIQSFPLITTARHSVFMSRSMFGDRIVPSIRVDRTQVQLPNFMSIGKTSEAVRTGNHQSIFQFPHRDLDSQ